MKAWIDKFRARRLTMTFTILITLSAGILIGTVVAYGVEGKEAPVNTSDAKALQIPPPVSLPTDFTKIAKEVGPAVVNINTVTYPKQQQQGKSQNPNEGMQDFFNHFFGFGGPEGGPEGGPFGQLPGGAEREALGSGMIVDPHGYIITNDHVINKADKIWVKLTTDAAADQGHPAKVVGFDKATDIAVLKIDVGHPLPTVQLGNSEGAQIGDWVVAIGSPFGLNQTVTAGIISSKNRSIPSRGPAGTGEFQHFIQTDAAINPGNSGGPLLNMKGQVIGMNTAIFTQSAGNEGIGFAMPSNTIINVYNQLIGPEHKVVRGSIGIQFQSNVSSAVAHVYGFKNGVIISAVTPGFPADKAGLKPGDVITSINGEPVKGGQDLISTITSLKPGTKATIGYVRNGKHETATVTIADYEKMMAALSQGGAPGETNGPGENGASKLGMTVSNVPQNVQDKAGITGGVIIRSIRPGSFADSLRMLAPGLVILQMNREQIQNADQFQQLVSKLKPGDDVVFLVVDPNRPQRGNTYVGGTLP
jgi:serine protease Do